MSMIKNDDKDETDDSNVRGMIDENHCTMGPLQWEDGNRIF